MKQRRRTINDLLREADTHLENAQGDVENGNCDDYDVVMQLKLLEACIKLAEAIKNIES